MKTSSSERASFWLTLPKSHLPIQGMSFRIGMPLSLSAFVFFVSPPITTVWRFSTETSLEILRVVTVA